MTQLTNTTRQLNLSPGLAGLAGIDASAAMQPGGVLSLEELERQRMEAERQAEAEREKRRQLAKQSIDRMKAENHPWLLSEEELDTIGETGQWPKLDPHKAGPLPYEMDVARQFGDKLQASAQTIRESLPDDMTGAEQVAALPGKWAANTLEGAGMLMHPRPIIDAVTTAAKFAMDQPGQAWEATKEAAGPVIEKYAEKPEQLVQAIVESPGVTEVLMPAGVTTGLKALSTAVTPVVRKTATGAGKLATKNIHAPGVLGSAKNAQEVKRSGFAPTENVSGEELSTITAVNVRNLSPDEAAARAIQGMHLKRNAKTGQYVGAPVGIDTPQKLQRLRARFDELLRLAAEGGELQGDWRMYDPETEKMSAAIKKGERLSPIEVGSGPDWYERTHEDVRTMAGPGDIDAITKLGKSLAWGSMQAPPETNLQFTLKGMQRHHMGADPDAPGYSAIRGPERDKPYLTAMEETEGFGPPLGEKTGIYAQKITPPEALPAELASSTNDIWHGRLWGYKNPDGSPWDSGFGATQHAFMDGETVLAIQRANAAQVGGRTNWDSRSVQSVPWVMINGIYQHMRYSDRLPTVDAGVESAQKTYGMFFPKHEAAITAERIPGVETQHLAGLKDQPFAVRQQYTDTGLPWTDEGGRSVLLDAAGVQQLPAREATGFFSTDKGIEINPAEIYRPLLPLGRDPTVGRRLDPQSNKLMQAIEAFRSYVEAQDMGAFHKTFPIGSSGSLARSANSLRVSGLDRKVSPEEMAQLAKIVEPHHGVQISDTGDGVTLMHFLPDEDAVSYTHLTLPTNREV